MIYTTTKCPHCGYRTRNRESGVPKVELGQTLACCPMCGNPIIDPIYTEYEFMTESEQSKWATEHISTTETIRGVAMIIIGIVLFIIGVAAGEGAGIVFGLLFGGGLIAMGIRRFVTVKKANSLNIGEQIIYESLLRTSNAEYVKLLEKAYDGERKYNPIPNRLELINEYQKYSTSEIHERYKEEFLKLLKLIENQENIEAEKVKESNSFVKGGALVGGIMSIPSAIVGVKQEKELVNKSEEDNKEESVVTESSVDKIEEKGIDADSNQEEFIIDNNESQVVSLNKKKLLELKELFEEGLITEEEYIEKKKQILEKL